MSRICVGDMVEVLPDIKNWYAAAMLKMIGNVYEVKKFEPDRNVDQYFGVDDGVHYTWWFRECELKLISTKELQESPGEPQEINCTIPTENYPDVMNGFENRR